MLPSSTVENYLKALYQAQVALENDKACLLYTSPSPRDS